MTDTDTPSQTSDPEIEVLSPEETASETQSNETPDSDPITTLQTEVERWKDLAYRSQAELDNFRKRAAREAQDTRSYANAEILRALFPILDNFEMGLDAARNESEKSMVFMGMSMVHRQMADFLRDHGVQEIEALGLPFDPNLHDAITQEQTADKPEGTVLRVTRLAVRIAFEEFHQVVPKYRRVADQLAWMPSSTFRSPLVLDLTTAPATSVAATATAAA